MKTKTQISIVTSLKTNEAEAIVSALQDWAQAVHPSEDTRLEIVNRFIDQHLQAGRAFSDFFGRTETPHTKGRKLG